MRLSGASGCLAHPAAQSGLQSRPIRNPCPPSCEVRPTAWSIRRPGPSNPTDGLARPTPWRIRQPGPSDSLAYPAVCSTRRSGASGGLAQPTPWQPPAIWRVRLPCSLGLTGPSGRLAHLAVWPIWQAGPSGNLPHPAIWPIRRPGAPGALAHPAARPARPSGPTDSLARKGVSPI